MREALGCRSAVRQIERRILDANCIRGGAILNVEEPLMV
jgi:hypothetical protein